MDKEPSSLENTSSLDNITNEVLDSLNRFLELYFQDSASESIKLAGGLNGHLSLARILILNPPLSRGMADVLVTTGALFHRLHYLRDILEKYAAALELPVSQIPVLEVMDRATAGASSLQRARSLYEAALAVSPNHSQASFNLASIVGFDDSIAAHALYITAAQSDPSLAPYAALRRATLLENEKRWNEAANLYLEAHVGLTHLGPWHANTAHCLRQVGRCEQALTHYELALDWVRQPGAEFLVTPTPPLSALGAGYARKPISSLQAHFGGQ